MTMEWGPKNTCFLGGGYGTEVGKLCKKSSTHLDNRFYSRPVSRNRISFAELL